MFLQRLYRRAILLVFLLFIPSNIFLLRYVWTRHDVRENAGQSSIDRHITFVQDSQQESGTATYHHAATTSSVPVSQDGILDDRIPVGEFQRYPLDINLSDVVLKIQRGETVSIAPINQFNRSTLIESRCGRDLRMVYIIKSHPRNTDARMAIRQTWGNETILQGVKRLFVVGTTAGNGTQANIYAENAMFQDLLQGDFPDFYYNSGTKMEYAIHWAVKNCSRVRYLVFLDDDVLVNPRVLLKLLESKRVRQVSRLYLGWFKGGHVPKRNSDSRYQVSFEDYPLLNYPPLAPAATYILNQELAQEVAIAMQFVKRIKFDDVYLALVMRKLGVPPFHTDLIDLLAHGYERSKESCAYISMLGEFSPHRLREAWIQLQRASSSSCNSRFHTSRFTLVPIMLATCLLLLSFPFIIFYMFVLFQKFVCVDRGYIT